MHGLGYGLFSFLNEQIVLWFIYVWVLGLCFGGPDYHGHEMLSVLPLIWSMEVTSTGLHEELIQLLLQLACGHLNLETIWSLVFIHKSLDLDSIAVALVRNISGFFFMAKCRGTSVSPEPYTGCSPCSAPSKQLPDRSFYIMVQSVQFSNFWGNSALAKLNRWIWVPAWRRRTMFYSHILNECCNRWGRARKLLLPLLMLCSRDVALPHESKGLGRAELSMLNCRWKAGPPVALHEQPEPLKREIEGASPW